VSLLGFGGGPGRVAGGVRADGQLRAGADSRPRHGVRGRHRLHPPRGAPPPSIPRDSVACFSRFPRPSLRVEGMTARVVSLRPRGPETRGGAGSGWPSRGQTIPIPPFRPSLPSARRSSYDSAPGPVVPQDVSLGTPAGQCLARHITLEVRRGQRAAPCQPASTLSAPRPLCRTSPPVHIPRVVWSGSEFFIIARLFKKIILNESRAGYARLSLDAVVRHGIHPISGFPRVADPRRGAGATC